MDYLVVKWLHVMSAVFLFGTGTGTAFYLFFTVRRGDVRAIAEVTRLVVVADWLFTATTLVIQPVTGLWLASRVGLALESTWLRVSLVLWAVALACWLPVVWLQLRLRDLAQLAVAAGSPLPPRFAGYFRAWIALGVPAFGALLAVFWLMVARPA